MKRLIINGDPGIRKGAVIRYDDQEVTCFSITRNGDYHGPERVQLWCVVGATTESDAFEHREFIPHFLETDAVDASAIEVVKPRGERAG